MEIVIDKDAMERIVKYPNTCPMWRENRRGGRCGLQVYHEHMLQFCEPDNYCPLHHNKMIPIKIEKAKGDDMEKMRVEFIKQNRYDLYIMGEYWGSTETKERAIEMGSRYNKTDEIVERLTKCLNAEGIGIDFLEMKEHPEYLRGAREVMQDILDMINPSPPDPPPIIDGVATRDIKKGERINHETT